MHFHGNHLHFLPFDEFFLPAPMAKSASTPIFPPARPAKSASLPPLPTCVRDVAKKSRKDSIIDEWLEIWWKKELPGPKIGRPAALKKCQCGRVGPQSSETFWEALIKAAPKVRKKRIFLLFRGNKLQTEGVKRKDFDGGWKFGPRWYFLRLIKGSENDAYLLKRDLWRLNLRTHSLKRH